MPDFADLALEYERIKDTPDAIGNTRTSDLNKNTGTAADSTGIRQDILPDEKTHYEKQIELTTMFDKSSRSGAKSKLHGLFLPNGRKMFKEFHDNYTGTGRYKPQVAPDKVQLPLRGRKLDTPQIAVCLYERCMICLSRVNRDECVPNIFFIPPMEAIHPMAFAKWQTVSLKPGMALGYLFCKKCHDEGLITTKAILHDPIKSKIMLPVPGGKMESIAEVEARKYIADRGARISDNVFETIKKERNNPDTDVFYGDGILD
jgi:hypothetical protein